MEIFHDFCDRLLERYGSNRCQPRRDITSQKFVDNALGYIANQNFRGFDFRATNVTIIDQQNKRISKDNVIESPPVENILEKDFCLYCGEDPDNTTLMLCSGCYKVGYCSTICHVKDWDRFHMEECQKLKDGMMDVLSVKNERKMRLGIIMQARRWKKDGSQDVPDGFEDRVGPTMTMKIL